jgi:ankyrin repeat protein
LKTLLDAGADPNVHGEYGNTPLHEAVGPCKMSISKRPFLEKTDALALEKSGKKFSDDCRCRL